MKIRPTRTIPRTLLSIAILASCAVGAKTVTDPDTEVIQLRKIEVDPVNGLVTLRWSSHIGSSYVIEETGNPKFGWQESVRDVSGDPLETSFTLLPQHSNLGAKTMLFRVRKMEGSEEEENNLQLVSTDKASSIETATMSGSHKADTKRKRPVDKTASNYLATKVESPSSLDRFILT